MEVVLHDTLGFVLTSKWKHLTTTCKLSTTIDPWKNGIETPIKFEARLTKIN